MMSQIQYMTAKEAADKWNISHRRVITLCQQNRIPNTAMLGNMWIIPKNAQKPGEKIYPARPSMPRRWI